MQDVPQFVLKRLRETAVAGSHPDADVLTAFAEQSLPVSERGRVIERLAACGDCRDVVALALPATEIEVAPVSTTRARGWWLGLPSLAGERWPLGSRSRFRSGFFSIRIAGNGDMVASNRAQEAVTLPSSSDLLHATQKAVSRTETGTQPSSVLDSPLPSGQKPAVEVSRRDRAAGHDIVIAQLAQNANALSAPVNSHSAAKRKNQVAQQIAQNDSPLLPDRGNATNLTSFDVVKAKDPVPAQSTSSNAPTYFGVPSVPCKPRHLSCRALYRSGQ